MFAHVALTLALLAADHHVTPGQSIQAAIDAAQDGDRVLLAAGTYTESIDYKGKAIEVQGVSAASTTISATNGATVTFHNGEGPDSILRGVTVTGGFGAYGGGISAYDGTNYTAPLIEDCIIRDNASWIGVGLGAAGAMTLRRCAIIDHFGQTADGGGVWGPATIENCVIANNTVTDGSGGGAYLIGGTIRDSVIMGNRSLYGAVGGGVAGSGTIERCRIFHNAALYFDGFTIIGHGAGVHGQFVIVDSFITQNNSGDDPDGVGGVDGPSTLVGSTVVRGNTATQIGDQVKFIP